MKAINYNATIEREGFTPTKCHYFTLNLFEVSRSIVLPNGKFINVKPFTSFRHVIFASNPLHAYVTECRDSNRPIIISGLLIIEPTGFIYVPHTMVNGKPQPLLCHKRNMITGYFKAEKVKLNTVRLFIDSNNLSNSKQILHNEIDRIKKYKI